MFNRIKIGIFLKDVSFEKYLSNIQSILWKKDKILNSFMITFNKKPTYLI